MNKLSKVLLSLAIACGGAAAAGPGAADAAAAKVTIMLDGYPLPFPVPPAVTGGTTMVPFRAISEALGITVLWNQQARQITATKQTEDGVKKIVLTVGSRKAIVNGAEVQLAAAPAANSGSVLIPLSFFSQQFGAQVSWNQATRTVTIQSPKSGMYTMAFYAIESFDEVDVLPRFDAASFGWSRIEQDGEFTTQGKEYRWPQAAGDITPERLVQDAAARGTAPYLMVYSGDVKLELTRNLEDPALGDRTIAGIVETAAGKGFSGITLDLEGLGLTGDKAKAKADYNAFVKKLSVKARQAGLKLTLVLHPLNSSYKGYDYKTLGTLADDLVIMAYDYAKSKKGPEPLDKVDESIRLALKEVAKNKLLLGISANSETAASISSKVGLAKRYGLKGIAVWRLGILRSDLPGLEATLEMN